MPSRGSEAWWFQYWGQPCNGPRSTVVLRGHRFTVDSRAVPAFQALDAVFARHGVDVHPPYPAGDSGTGNCRHIGNDPSRPWSAHAWWAALDRNWNTNPDGSWLRTDLARSVIDDVHAIRTRSGAPVWRWGGDWDRDPRTGHSYYDAMHFEVHATPSEIATGIVLPWTPTPPPSEEDWFDMASRADLEQVINERVPALVRAEVRAALPEWQDGAPLCINDGRPHVMRTPGGFVVWISAGEPVEIEFASVRPDGHEEPAVRETVTSAGWAPQITAGCNGFRVQRYVPGVPYIVQIFSLQETS